MKMNRPNPRSTMPRPSKPQPQPPEPNDPHGFTALMQAFLEWLRVRNYPPRTFTSREQYLRAFATWATERGLSGPAEVTKPILERYQRYLFYRRKPNGDPLSFPTQLNHLLPLRAWF